MESTFSRILISAPSLDEARRIQLKLVEEKLLAGGLITSGESVYWWDGKTTQKTYFNISAFTKTELAPEIIARVKEFHSDEVPIIAFFSIDVGNGDFLQWIAESTREAKRVP